MWRHCPYRATRITVIQMYDKVFNQIKKAFLITLEKTVLFIQNTDEAALKT
jgi:hypothetical protein